MIAQQKQNFLETVFPSTSLFRGLLTFLLLSFRRGEGRTEGLACHIGMLGNAGQFFGDVLRRQNEIHTTSRDGAARHRVISSRFILSESNPALSLDGLHA